MGIPDEEAAYYSEGVRRGGALVVVNVDDAMVPIATAVLHVMGAIHPEARRGTEREDGAPADA